jgi:hypothetical protein
VNGWQGSGYTVLDPEMGVGAYQISGGASGGSISGAVGLLLAVAGTALTVGQFVEAIIGLGTLFAKIGGALGPIAALLSVIDAKISGCGVNASIGIFAFSLTAWIQVLMLSFFTIPLLGIIAAVVAISLAQFLITSAIKEDFCNE